MNKIRKVLRSIIKFFDKKLITPITKFFLWFTETTKTKGKNFEKILSMKSSLVIISLLISVFIFFYVDTKSTTILETSAEVLYKQVVEQLQASQEISDYATTYSAMKPKEAAAIFDTMTDNLSLVADILQAMDAESRANILGKMSADTAAKVTEIMEPDGM